MHSVVLDNSRIQLLKHRLIDGLTFITSSCYLTNKLQLLQNFPFTWSAIIIPTYHRLGESKALETTAATSAAQSSGERNRKAA